MREGYTILHTESSKQWGAQQKRTLAELCVLHSQGHHPFLCASSKSKLWQKTQELGYIRCIDVEFTYKNILKALRQLLRLFKTNSIHIGVTHSSKDAWICSIAAKIAKTFGYGPMIVRRREQKVTKKRPLNHYLLYNLLSDATICAQKETAEFLKKQARLEAKRVFSIARGVDVTKVEKNESEEKELREILQVGSRDLLIGSYGSEKDEAEPFIQVACLLLKKEALERPLWPFMRFVMMTNGESLRRLRDLRSHYCEQLAAQIESIATCDRLLDLPALKLAYSRQALEKRILFIDPEKKVAPFLGALDLFCVLSCKEERTSQLALQAALQETPLLCSKNSKIEQVEQAAVRTENNSKCSIAKAIEEILQSSETRKRLKKAKKNQVDQSLSVEQSLSKTLALYTSLLGSLNQAH